MNNNDEYSKLSKRAIQFSMATGLILLVSKFIAWHFTSSATLLSSLTDSSLDFLASIFSFAVLTYSLKPADDDHRFGHGKAEGLAAIFQSGIVLVAGLSVLYQGVQRLLNPTPMGKTGLAIGIMLFSLVLTLLLITYQEKVYKKTGSLVVKADRAHFVSDILANAGAIVALIFAYMGVPHADAIGGIIVAILIIKASWEVFEHALEMLLDHELPEEEVKEFEAIIQKETEILGYHDVRTRRSGKTLFFQVHLEFEDEVRLMDAHEVADRIEDKVKMRWENSDCLVHMDPISAVNEELIAHRQKLKQN
ncbi:cation diffusion facilitator family transporter [Lentisphaera profundi]|uniref:Cation diffusion facilitator family transporter n=1 Tax=Lentisphaera profundi TaxID=1658616 RepID=A0ABY7VPV4_9BACT|nr:cation diffusion facilitator family transporter [Lentisphaera profundi]WDE96195.1 cation diffusion facilitator family transporter [Lentisphaera profundi]